MSWVGPDKPDEETLKKDEERDEVLGKFNDALNQLDDLWVKLKDNPEAQIEIERLIDEEIEEREWLKRGWAKQDRKS